MPDNITLLIWHDSPSCKIDRDHPALGVRQKMLPK
jgi:hypothetical protein